MQILHLLLVIMHLNTLNLDGHFYPNIIFNNSFNKSQTSFTLILEKEILWINSTKADKILRGKAETFEHGLVFSIDQFKVSLHYSWLWMFMDHAT